MTDEDGSTWLISGTVIWTAAPSVYALRNLDPEHTWVGVLTGGWKNPAGESLRQL